MFQEICEIVMMPFRGGKMIGKSINPPVVHHPAIFHQPIGKLVKHHAGGVAKRHALHTVAHIVYVPVLVCTLAIGGATPVPAHPGTYLPPPSMVHEGESGVSYGAIGSAAWNALGHNQNQNWGVLVTPVEIPNYPGLEFITTGNGHGFPYNPCADDRCDNKPPPDCTCGPDHNQPCDTGGGGGNPGGGTGKVPEPNSLLLMLFGIFTLGLYRYARNA